MKIGMKEEMTLACGSGWMLEVSWLCDPCSACAFAWEACKSIGGYVFFGEKLLLELLVGHENQHESQI